MVTAVCPTEANADETHCALVFAARVRRITLAPTQRNVVHKHLQDELVRTRAELSQSKEARSSVEHEQDTLRGQLTQARNQLSETRDVGTRSVESVRKEKDAEVEQQRRRCGELQARLDSERSSREKFADEHSGLTLKVKRLTTQNDALQQRVKARDEELSTLRAQLRGGSHQGHERPMLREPQRAREKEREKERPLCAPAPGAGAPNTAVTASAVVGSHPKGVAAGGADHHHLARTSRYGVTATAGRLQQPQRASKAEQAQPKPTSAVAGPNGGDSASTSTAAAPVPAAVFDSEAASVPAAMSGSCAPVFPSPSPTIAIASIDSTAAAIENAIDEAEAEAEAGVREDGGLAEDSVSDPAENEKTVDNESSTQRPLQSPSSSDPAGRVRAKRAIEAHKMRMAKTKSRAPFF